MRAIQANAILSSRNRLLSYAKAVDDSYLIGPAHIKIANALERIERGELKRLMVFMPPRMGKSRLCAQIFPSWILCRHAKAEIIQTGYGNDIALEHSRKARAVFLGERTAQIFPALRPSEKIRRIFQENRVAAHEWGTMEGGKYYATGIGGAITGKGADYLIVDDPHKNRQEAESKTKRDQVYTFYKSTLYTRLSPTGAILLIMTRWHIDDLAARLLDEMKQGMDQWEIISLKPFDETGESIWPERWPKERLLDIKKNTIPLEWCSQYEQDPVPSEGAVFKREWWNEPGRRFNCSDIQVHNACLDRIQSWDTAQSEKDTAAFSAGGTFELTRTYKMMLTDVMARRMEFPELVDNVIRYAEKGNYDGKLSAVLIEKASSGVALIQYLRSNGPEWLRDKIIDVNPTESKLIRGLKASKWCNIGSVLLPKPDESIEWLFDFEADLFSFPGCKYKDKIDMFNQAIWYWENLLTSGAEGV